MFLKPAGSYVWNKPKETEKTVCTEEVMGSLFLIPAFAANVLILMRFFCVSVLTAVIVTVV